MRKLIILALMSWFATTTNGFAARLIGIAAFTGDVYSIDTNSPQTPSLLFSLGSGRDFAGLAYSNVRKTFFTFSRAENKIYEFNRSGRVLKVLTLDRALTPGFGGPRGIMFDVQGRLYVVGYNNDVFEVSLTNGKSTLRFRAAGATSEVESIAPLDNNTFLGVGVRSQLLLITRGTGVTANFASLPAGDLDAMTGITGGWIYMSESGSDSQLHGYNPFTQTYQNLGWTGIPHLSSLEEFWWDAK